MSKEHRAFVAQIPWDGTGKPDLDLPADTDYWVEWPGRLWHAHKGEHQLTILKLGEISGEVVVQGVGTNKVLQFLAGLATRIALLKDAWQVPAQKQWLLDHGMQETADGKPIPLIMYSGDNTIALGSDENGDIP